MKFKIGLLFLTILLNFNGLWSQNLVSNPGFEAFTFCPFFHSQIAAATGWSQPGAGTSDYFNSCSTNNIAGVPFNDLGNQFARSGEGYAGVICFSIGRPEGREYIQSRLSSPMIAGIAYEVSFWVSMGDTVAIAQDRIGAYFSPTAISSTVWDYFPVIPQIENDSGTIIADFTSWTQVIDTFTAAGGEQFITLGNFRPDSLIDTLTVQPGRRAYTYFYIDDVLCRPLANPNDSLTAGHDTLICPGDSVTLYAAGASSYQWGDIANPDTILSTNDSLVVAPQLSRTYYVTNGTDTILVTVSTYPPLPPDLGWPDTTRRCDYPFVLDATRQGATYRWQDGSTNPTYLVEESGTYAVTVTTLCGDIHDQTVADYLEEAHYVPNVFTPNGDGQNEFFAVEVERVEANGYRLIVVDRWGNLAFESTDPNLLWDGQINGSPAREGVYYYKLEYLECNDQPGTEVGFVTLLR